MKLAGNLKHLWSLLRFLSWRIPDGLVAPPRLGPEAVDDLLRDIVNYRPAVDEGGGVKQALVHALLDDFPDGGLG